MFPKNRSSCVVCDENVLSTTAELGATRLVPRIALGMRLQDKRLAMGSQGVLSATIGEACCDGMACEVPGDRVALT